MGITDKRFWENTKEVDGGCIEWQLSKTQFGYGRLNKAIGPLSGSWLAHRYAFTLANGVIPKGLYVCHSCDNKLCVNPEHLWLGTAKENSQDCYDKGRSKLKNPKEYANWKPTRLFGSKNHATKLTQKDIVSIREMYGGGKLQREIAEIFRVSQVAISVVLRGKTWASQTA